MYVPSLILTHTYFFFQNTHNFIFTDLLIYYAYSLLSESPAKI